MWPNPQETVDLVSFTEEILNGKLHFFSSAQYSMVVYKWTYIYAKLSRQIVFTLFKLYEILKKGRVSTQTLFLDKLIIR